MKTYIVTLIFLLAMQNSYCAQSEPLNLVDFYYVDSYQKKLDGDELIPVFLKQALQNRIDYKLSNVGWNTVAIKKWFHIMVCSILYTVKTPYIYLEQSELEWYLEAHKRYFKFEDELYPCSNQLPQSLLFVEKPHCGDLAFCIRQTNNIEDQDELLKLLDASYEVQKLMRFENEYFTIMHHSVHLRNKVMPLIDALYGKNFTQYTVENYRSFFKKVFYNAVISYSLTIIKHAILLFLMSNKNLDFWSIIRFYSIMSGIDIVVLWSFADLKAYGSNVTILFLIWMLHNNIVNNEMYYYSKILSMYWIGYSSFFLTMLFYRYNNFEKVMNDYERYLEMFLKRKQEGQKDDNFSLI